MTLDELSKKVWDWFDEKGLSDPVMQMVKVQEEIGELAHEISRGHRDTNEVVDALGDSLVTIIGMCHHLNIRPDDALSQAYNEIKNRKGKVIDGSFVKCE
jgi:NTP pyrophosphatase (non-canonical NTP hydrolase)